MNVYILNELENGDILLKSQTININNYTVIHNDNGDILLQKNILYIHNISELKDFNFTKSKILKCIININESINTKLKYKSILNFIYNKINDGCTIIKNSQLNIKTIKKQNEGFYYYENLGISVQSVDSNKCIIEILNQCIKNNIQITMEILLENNNIINISL